MQDTRLDLKYAIIFAYSNVFIIKSNVSFCQLTDYYLTIWQSIKTLIFMTDNVLM